MMPGAEVLVERVGHRADIVLNRPERKNAVTAALATQLREAILSADADPSVGAIVLRGAGGSFCSGIDLKVAGAGLVDEPLDAWVEVHIALHACRVPIVVALERFAINAGAALALAGHVVVAGESSFLQVSEITMGVAAPMCQAWLHLRHSAAVGDRLTLLADRVPAAELLRLGLVTEVVPDAEVIARATELAERIAAYPVEGRAAVQATWRLLRSEPADPAAWFRTLVAGRRTPEAGG
ncbi:MAG: enoyl-CoA hydratase/isomerase family protein [Ilumatobacteraceae bacterium]